MKIYSADITGSIATKVQAFDTNPTSPAVSDGSFWINRAGSLNFSYQSSSIAGAVWSTGGAVATGAGIGHGGSGGGQDSAIVVAGGTGYNYNYGNVITEAYEYDGTSWTAGTDVTVGRSAVAGAGSQNAFVLYGGLEGYYRPDTLNYSCTEEFDGSSWATSNAMNVGRSQLGGDGTQNAALAVGGSKCASNYGNTMCTCTEEYNGTAWTAVNNLQSHPYTDGIAVGGSQNAILALGGACAVYSNYAMRSYLISSSPSYVLTCAESYDGTSWSNITAIPTKRAGAVTGGTQNDAFLAGGHCYNAYCTLTNLWDGSVWTTGPSHNIARTTLGRSNDGSSNAVSIFGGFPGICCTEHYDKSMANNLISKEVVAKSGLVSSSAAFGMLSQDGAHRSGSFSGSLYGSGAGLTQIVAQVATTVTITDNESTNEDNAIVFTAGGDLDGGNLGLESDGDLKYNPSTGTLSATTFVGSGAGITNVATPSNLVVTGSIKLQSTEPQQIPLLTADPPINTLGGGSLWINRVTGCLNYTYLSSSIGDRVWTAGGTTGNTFFRSSVAGSQNAAVLIGGQCKSGNSNAWYFGVCTQEYDGSSWTGGGNQSTQVSMRGATGTLNATLAFGGNKQGPFFGAPGDVNATEEYDGSSWSNSGTMPYTRADGVGVGNQNSTIGYGFACIPYYGNESPFGNWIACAETFGYDGSAWVQCNDMILDSKGQRAKFGTVDAAVAAGAFPNCGCVEEWDGTSWATGAEMAQTVVGRGGAGTQNSGVAWGGSTVSGNTFTNIANSEIYNGSAWSTGPNMGTARHRTAHSGTDTAAIAVSSAVPAWVNNCCTEEYTEGSLDTTLVQTVSSSAYSY